MTRTGSDHNAAGADESEQVAIQKINTIVVDPDEIINVIRTNQEHPGLPPLAFRVLPSGGDFPERAKAERFRDAGEQYQSVIDPLYIAPKSFIDEEWFSASPPRRPYSDGEEGDALWAEWGAAAKDHIKNILRVDYNRQTVRINVETEIKSDIETKISTESETETATERESESDDQVITTTHPNPETNYVQSTLGNPDWSALSNAVTAEIADQWECSAAAARAEAERTLDNRGDAYPLVLVVNEWLSERNDIGEPAVVAQLVDETDDAWQLETAVDDSALHGWWPKSQTVLFTAAGDRLGSGDPGDAETA